ncbi:restriction endonuclease subunit S [Micromonospora sediminicola]|uniref:restriction endonuclease subunit S n=1 Tax=Micromonospora sediminicola TaxID=946078 RepID=UPI0033F62272
MTGAWPERKLGDLVRLTSGQSPSAFRFRGTGTPYFKVDQLGKSSKYLSHRETPYLSLGLPLVPAGSILIAKRGGAIALNRVRMLSEPGFMDTNVMALTPGDEIEPEFLYYWLLYRGLWDIADVTSVPQINNKHINPLSIALPSLPEQRRIAEALQSVDGQSDGLESVIAKKRAITQGMMQELLTGRTRLPGFSGGWEARKFSELVGIRSGQVDPRLPAYKHLPLIAPDHIESGTGRLLDVRTAEQQGAISGKYLVYPGDIIYSKIRPNLRKVYMAEFPALCSADMYPLKPRPGMDGRFIVSTLLGRDFTEFAVGVSMRSGIPKINRTELAGFELAVPPMDEQRQIGKALANVDALIASLERRLESTRAIKQGMMQELLTGRTRLVAAEASA